MSFKSKCEWFTNAFPIWVIGCGIAAMIHPPLLTWFSGPFITYGLGVIMLGMGLTLKADDFKRILQYPKWILTGVFLQFTIMPFAGWGIAKLLNLPPLIATGLILVSCCPGGTASNVIAFVSRANVALSVSMTAISTLMAILMTPVLTDFLVGSRMEVDAMGLFFKTVQVVLIPIIVGVCINTFFHKKVERVLPVAPPIAVIVIALIVGSVIGAQKANILKSGIQLFLSVGLLHLIGFLLGYFLTKFLIKKEDVARTVSIEVGMQNSGLGVVLAKSNFGINGAIVAIPCAVSAMTHCIYGSIAAFFWSKDPKEETQESEED